MNRVAKFQVPPQSRADQKAIKPQRSEQWAKVFIWSIALFLSLLWPNGSRVNAQAALAAFPGAQGFGSTTPGGRGPDGTRSRVIFVTHLRDSGEGSFRAAVTASGPRFVLFKVNGVIRLESDIDITTPFLTVAGQSAQASGVTVSGGTVHIRANDVVIRFMRFRVGAQRTFAGTCRDEECDKDALEVAGAERVVIDHCSVSWSIDEALSVNNSKDVTIQWCIISEPLRRPLKPNGKPLHSEHGIHDKGSLLRGSRRVLVHHSLYAHCNDRTPMVSAAGDANIKTEVWAINNVIYDWGEEAVKYNAIEKDDDRRDVVFVLLNNKFVVGPDTTSPPQSSTLTSLPPTFEIQLEKGGLHPLEALVEGNLGPHRTTVSQDEWAIVGFLKSVNDKLVVVSDPAERNQRRQRVEITDATRKQQLRAQPGLPLPLETAEVIFERILNKAGAILLFRDEIDRRVVQQVRTGTGHFINSETEVGGFRSVGVFSRQVDTDNDGIPDDYEETHGLSKQNPDDALNRQSDGYTNLEAYLNDLVAQARVFEN